MNLNTDHIYEAQHRIKDFISQIILPQLTFDDWKKSLALSLNGNKEDLNKKWDLFGNKFSPLWIEPDIIASGDWIPSMMFTYKWIIKDAEIPVRIMAVKNTIQYVEICDMFNVAKHFGSDFDFSNEFEKNVVMIKHLSS